MERNKNHLDLLDTEPLRDPELFAEYYKKMPASRRRKIDAFRFEKDKRLSLGAGILLRHGLKRRYPDMDVSQEEIMALGEYEKPYLRGVEDFFFNLSHSGHVAAAAFSNRPAGIDVEENRHFEEKLIRYLFSGDDVERICVLDEDPDLLFTRLWTIKESVMKYLGKGMAIAPKSILLDSITPAPALPGENTTAGEEILQRCSGRWCSRMTIPACAEKGREEHTQFFTVTSWSLDGYQLSICLEDDNCDDEPVWLDPRLALQ